MVIQLSNAIDVLFEVYVMLLVIIIGVLFELCVMLLIIIIDVCCDLWWCGCIYDRSFVSFTGEYCETEIFKAVCDTDQVVVMKKARYGRMKIGTCVRKDLG